MAIAFLRGPGSALALALALLGACVPTPAASAAARAVRPIQLVETRPIETPLGNPVLPAARDVWLEMIRGARKSIDVEGFYLSNWPKEPLEPVLAALADAGRRGVKVRLLFDRSMHKTYPQPLDSLGRLPGIEARTLDVSRITGGVLHAKYFLIDGAETFVGSQNFDWRSLEHIHELGVRVREPKIAAAFQTVFEGDWLAADTTTWTVDAHGTKRPRPFAPAHLAVPMRIVQAPGDTVLAWPSYSPRGFIPDSTRWDRDAVERLIDSAKAEIELQLLTYGVTDRGETDSTLDQALRRAAARGVRVRMVISDWVVNASGIQDLKSLAQAPGVEIKLSTLPEWSGGYIPFARVEHCKYAVADSAAMWLGTSNWEPGYFSRLRNLGLTLQNRALALDARRVFEASWIAPSAAPIQPGFRYPEKIRGLTPPAGSKTVYGK